MSARTDWTALIAESATIVESYDTGVTLRQLFYRLVAKGLLPNTTTTYKSLSKYTATARRDGSFPELIDPTRSIDRPAAFTGPDAARDWLAHIYRRDRTEGQDTTVYLGVEKAGILEQLRSWFGDYGVPIIALRGYSSQTFVGEVRQDVEMNGRPAVLLYAGDFDPSGEDILRDFLDRTRCFDHVDRIALNESQVERYSLPPQMGKAADSRAAAFVARYGRLVQVELDALAPDVLRGLYEQAFAGFWEKSTYEAVTHQEAAERAAFAGERMNTRRPHQTRLSDPPARCIPLVPALRQWRREVRDSHRTTYTFDVLWAAACEEASAVEWFNDGLPRFAMRAFERARFYHWAA